MAEIEHFVHPDKRNDFHKFSSVADLRITFFSASRQMDGSPAEELRLGEAVKSVGHVTVAVSKKSRESFVLSGWGNIEGATTLYGFI